ncbi:MAG: efflux RND transporter periplasmic adaptor subunit [Bacteroidales bacterium]
MRTIFFTKGKMQTLNKLKVYKLLSLFLLSFLLVLVSCGGKQEEKKQEEVATEVSVIKIKAMDVTSQVPYATRITGLVNSDVRAKVSGYITEVLVDEGAKVRKGQILFKLETQSLDQEAKAAQAQIKAAEVEVMSLKPLVEKDVISEVQLETAKAKLEQAKSNYSTIMANIGYARIASPVNGYVGEIRLRTGALVSPSDQTPLTTVSDISKVYAYFSMNEKNYLDFMMSADGTSREEKIKHLPPVTLELANGVEYTHQGKVETVNSQIDNTTGTVTLRAIFDNPDGLLTNGSSGRIIIPNSYSQVLCVPMESTVKQQDKVLVYKVGSDNRLTTEVLSIIGTTSSLYIVDAGIKIGESIVAQGASKIQSGMLVSPKEVDIQSMINSIPTKFK